MLASLATAHVGLATSSRADNRPCSSAILPLISAMTASTREALGCRRAHAAARLNNSSPVAISLVEEFSITSKGRGNDRSAEDSTVREQRP